MKIEERYYCDDCYDCGKQLVPATHIQEPDPFAEELNGDETPCDLCDKCYEDSLMDI